MVSALTGQKAVVAKLGMDAHWRGAIVVASALKDAGMEVVYVGHATPAEAVRAVVHEDAILLGLSSLSGNHMTECPPILEGLRHEGAHDVVVVLGGTVPRTDEGELQAMGVEAIFGPGTPLPVIIDRLSELVSDRAATRLGTG